MADTSPIAFKEKTIAAAVNAVAGTPPNTCAPGCKPCHRVSLQFLVVTPSVVPKEHAAALKDAGYAWAPSFDAEFGNMPRTATTPVARIARTGYILVYYPERKRWDVWQVMANGLTRKVMYQVNTEQYSAMQSGFNNAPEPKLCSRGAANLPGSLISIERCVDVDQIWLTYSAHLWLPAVLQQFADNAPGTVTGADGKAITKPLRELHGRSFSPKAILAGSGAFPTGCLPLNAAGLEHGVADFAKEASRDFKKAFDLSLRPLDAERFGQAAEFDKQVRAIERASGPSGNPELYLDKSLIVMLPDPVGVAEQHNTIRLATLSAQQGWMAGGLDAKGANADPNRPWERQSLLHAAYVREWVRDAEHQHQKALLDNGAYRRSQTISGDEYRHIQAQEKTSGKPYNPPGTRYEKLQGDVERYRVVWPQTAMDQGIKGVAQANTQSRIDRYNKHLDQGRIEAANKKWLEQDKAWATLTEARDADHVAWLESTALAVALRYTHGDNSALRKTGLKREDVVAHMFDVATRMEDTARCYAGGACSDASLKHLIKLFERDPKDKAQWIADALVGQYNFWDLINGDDTDHGLRADLYTGALGVRSGYEQAAQGAQLLRQGMAQHASLLVQASQQTLAKMQELALDAQQAGKYGLKSDLAKIQRKQVFWVKATALHHYLETGSKLFYLNVAWDARAFVNAALDAVKAGPAIEMKFNQHTPRQRQSHKSAAASARAELARAIANSAHPEHLTVPLLMDQAAVEATAKRGHKVGPGMLQVVGGNLLGLPQVPLALPEEFARELFKQQAQGRAETFKQWGETSVQNARGVLPASVGNAFIFFLQWRAFTFALGEFDKSGGWAQVDAAASALSAAVGMLGAGLEVGSLLLAPTSITKAGTPAAGVLVSQLPKAYLRLGLGAGLMGATGAALDGAVAFAKMRGRQERGDSDAATLYGISAGFHAGGFVSLFYGSWMAYRSAVLTKAGVQGAVRVLSFRFASSFAAAGIGMSATGIGMFLWVAGVGFSVVGAMLEDDENETFLERSYFGSGSNTQLGKFANLEDEVQALATLARGFRAELEWQDNMTEPDVVTARLQTVEWDRNHRGMSFVLDGYDMINGAKLVTLAEGELNDPKAEGGLYKVEQQVKITAPGVQAVKLTFTLWNTEFRLPNVPLKQNRGARKIAEDFIWMKD